MKSIKTKMNHLKEGQHNDSFSSISQTATRNVSCCIQSLYFLLSPTCLSCMKERKKERMNE